MKVLLSVPPCVRACRHSHAYAWRLQKAVAEARRRAFLAQRCDDDDLYTLLSKQEQRQQDGKEGRRGNTPTKQTLNFFASNAQCFLASEPHGQPLGSGAGTMHLLRQCFVQEVTAPAAPYKERHAKETMAEFAAWLRRGQRVIIHAGGQSRRLPSYATLGKSFVPLPLQCQQPHTTTNTTTNTSNNECEVMYGADVRQTLLSEQLVWLFALLQAAPPQLNTVVACGDVLLRDNEHSTSHSLCVGTHAAWRTRFAHSLQHAESNVDVLCLGLPCTSDPTRLTRHGALLCCERDGTLCAMRQKMSAQALQELHNNNSGTKLRPLLDSGVWLLSARALEALHECCMKRNEPTTKTHASCELLPPLRPYDLYGEFGPYVLQKINTKSGDGKVKDVTEADVLRTHALPLPHTTFYHLGTSVDLLQAMSDMSHARKESTEQIDLPLRHADTASGIIIQNSLVYCPLPSSPQRDTSHDDKMNSTTMQIWIENSHIAANWRLHTGHIITNVPPNDWSLTLSPGVCVDIVPIKHDTRKKDHEAIQCDSTAVSSSLQTEGASYDAQQNDKDAEALCYVARPYGLRDSFSGRIDCSTTQYLQQPLHEWLQVRDIALQELYPNTIHDSTSMDDMPHTTCKPSVIVDIQDARLFPCCTSMQQLGLLLAWMTAPSLTMLSKADCLQARTLWCTLPRYSAADLLQLADVAALVRQREQLRACTLTRMISEKQAGLLNSRKTYNIEGTSDEDMFALPASRLWRLNLKSVADAISRNTSSVPNQVVLKYEGVLSGSTNDTCEADSQSMIKARRSMLLAELCSACHNGSSPDAVRYANDAFSHLRNLVMRGVQQQQQEEEEQSNTSNNSLQMASATSEAIRPTHVCARCPVRIDLCGGWTDTPPYSLLFPGHVINAAININGAAPIEVHIRPHRARELVLHSLDRGVCDVIRTYDEIRPYATVDSSLSLARACLAVAGFLPEFATQYVPNKTVYANLQTLLAKSLHGCGFVLTMHVAVAAGSGLGSSSLLAGTILAALNTYYQFNWSRTEMARLVLVVEQMVTAGGGWQDAYGGFFAGIKHIVSQPARRAQPVLESSYCDIRIEQRLPTALFCEEPYKACHLLYFTGRTRVAKNIVARVVRNVLLNDAHTLRVLQYISDLHKEMTEAIVHMQIERYGRLVQRSMYLNAMLDELTCPADVRHVLQTARPYVFGAKTAGAGGGGYVYMVAKSAKDAEALRTELAHSAPNKEACFVDMTLCHRGLQVTST